MCNTLNFVSLENFDKFPQTDRRLISLGKNSMLIPFSFTSTQTDKSKQVHRLIFLRTHLTHTHTHTHTHTKYLYLKILISKATENRYVLEGKDS